MNNKGHLGNSLKILIKYCWFSLKLTYLASMHDRNKITISQLYLYLFTVKRNQSCKRGKTAYLVLLS